MGDLQDQEQAPHAPGRPLEGPQKAPGGPEEAPWDSQEQARAWRRRAEAFWRLSKLLDDLAVRTRNCAHWCDAQADVWDGKEQS
jgi:hypothetical protein